MATFFALSRDNNALLNELNLTFPPDSHAELDDVQQHHHFDWQHGEFCAVLVQQQTRFLAGADDAFRRRLIFGRDVFGRKSLCWRMRIGQSADNSKCDGNGSGDGGIFQLSVLPGRNDTNEESEGMADGWHEVPPGNIVYLLLPPCSQFKLFPNAKMPSTLRDFHCHLPSLSAFVAQTLRVHTYYPHESVGQNALFKAFKGGTDFTTAEGAQQILLRPFATPSADQQQQLLLLDHAQIEEITGQFVRRFSAAIRGIFLSLPSSAVSDLLEVPVLFSGGVDSLMVALMAAEVLSSASSPPIDGQAKQWPKSWAIRLFSVAFGDKAKDNFNEASDRAQSIAAFEYLKSRSTEKYGLNVFSLVLVNVCKEELVECRHKHIADAIAPSKTVRLYSSTNSHIFKYFLVLDDSIGCVLWFASRMKGIDFENGQQILCPSPFALVGSGSDEQLGGYARHQTVFKSKGLDGVAEELSMEMHRIGARNFGRDDRIGTVNGKSLLAPFLEEPLVRWLNTLPTALKTGFGLPTNDGTANKFLLRNALRSLGVPECFVQRPKRAMQFGTRMVKMETAENGDAKLRGHQICEKLML
ncbi:hypothetical protein niasHT_031732 [Heterodera trifolii]|uniref:Asparagine synthetase domain-containing protein n=1 Tax=Heterodera trifolii TaxID=157864 RepID=A0ABD2IY58_9BILA